MNGRVVLETFDSALLRDNPLGDPTARVTPVYLPPSYDAQPERRYPVLYFLVGYTGWGRSVLVSRPWQPSLPEQLDRAIAAGAPEVILVAPDCFTRLGGSQYVDSSATGPYERYLLEELVPAVDARFRTLAHARNRGVMGKSSGGFGALHLAMRKPELFGAVASHSGDMYFDYCYLADMPKLVNALAKHQGPRGFLQAFEAQTKKSRTMVEALNVLAMAACYSPDPQSELGIALPFDAAGRMRDEVWQRWLAFDPVRLIERNATALRRMSLVYLDCGERDEYALHIGARILAERLRAHGVAHEHEEFDDGHGDTWYRYDISLPKMARAVSG